MQFILSTLLTALPAILPVFVLMCARIWPMRFRAQKVLMAAAFLCYAEALAALHCMLPKLRAVRRHFSMPFTVRRLS